MQRLKWSMTLRLFTTWTSGAVSWPPWPSRVCAAGTWQCNTGWLPTSTAGCHLPLNPTGKGLLLRLWRNWFRFTSEWNASKEFLLGLLIRWFCFLISVKCKEEISAQAGVVHWCFMREMRSEWRIALVCYFSLHLDKVQTVDNWFLLNLN